MSKAFSQFRTAFVGFVALLQLVLLPATHVLHLGCQHPHGHVHTSDSSVFDTLEDVWGWCRKSHCCDHCQTSARDSDAARNAPNQRPAEQPHDEDSCPVCQAVFAARIGTTAPVAVLQTQPIRECLAEYSPSFRETPRFSVLSRGPPLLGVG